MNQSSRHLVSNSAVGDAAQEDSVDAQKAFPKNPQSASLRLAVAKSSEFTNAEGNSKGCDPPSLCTVARSQANIFFLLFNEPDLMENVISLLDFPYRYLAVYPRLSCYILSGSDKYFWVRFKVRIPSLFGGNVHDQIFASTPSSPIVSFLELLHKNNLHSHIAIREYLLYLGFVAGARGMLSFCSVACFVTFCQEFLLVKTLAESLLTPAWQLELHPIEKACDCNLHSAWISRIKNHLLAQRNPLPDQFLQWICARYGCNLPHPSSGLSRLLIFFCVLTDAVDIENPEAPEFVVFLMLIMALADFPDHEMQGHMVDDAIARMRAYYFPLPLERSYFDRTATSQDMRCLRAMALETAIVAFVFNLFFIQRTSDIPDAHIDFLCAFFNYLNDWCQCPVHGRTAGTRLLEVLFLSRTPIPIRFMRRLVDRYSEINFCKDLLVFIGLNTPEYSEEMFLLVSQCLMDRRVMRNVMAIGEKKAMKKLHEWTKMYGRSSTISEIVQIAVLDLEREPFPNLKHGKFPSLVSTAALPAVSMDFYLFEGKSSRLNTKPINLGGSTRTTLNRQDLFQSIELERKAREHLRQSIEAAGLVQRFFIHRLRVVQLKDVICEQLMANMNKMLAALDVSLDTFLPYFRMAAFGEQVIPEPLLHRVMRYLAKGDELALEVRRAAYFLLLKYCLATTQHLTAPYSFVQFCLENYSQLHGFGFLSLFHRFICTATLELSEIVAILKRFPKVQPGCLFIKFFAKLMQEPNPAKTLELHLSNPQFVSIFKNNSICLQSLIEYYTQDASISEVWDSLPFEFDIFLDSSSCQTILDLLLEKRYVGFPRWLFNVIYCESASKDDSKYFESFCRLVHVFLIENQKYLNNAEDSLILNIHDRLGKLSLTQNAKEAIEQILRRASILFNSISPSKKFLEGLIDANVENGAEQLSTFALLHLYSRLNTFLYDYNFELDDTLRLFVKKFQLCHGALFEYASKNILVGMIAWLDRENCIREFLKMTPLFPPGSCLLSPISGLLDERHLQFPYCSPLSQRIDTFQQFCRTKMSELRRASGKVTVRRGFELEDAQPHMAELGPQTFILFEGEQGFGIGITKEFILNALTQSLNIEFGLFEITPDQKVFPASIQKSPALFELTGRLLGMALMYKVCVDSKIKFDFALLSAFKSGRLIVDDLFFIDAQLYKNLAFLSQHNASDLFLSLSLVSDEIEGKQEVDLVPNGRSIAVTDANKHDYIELVAMHKLHTQNVNALLRGLHSLIPGELLGMFNEAELCMMISGLGEEIDMNDWKTHTRFGGTHQPIHVETFWGAVEQLSPKERCELLRFATGCPRPPLMGFEWMNPQFNVMFTTASTNSLPISHTCFNQLVIPNYEDVENAVEKLKTSIANLSAGFQAP